MVIFFHHGVKKLADIVGNTKQFSNFVLGEFARVKRINFPVPMIHSEYDKIDASTI